MTNVSRAMLSLVVTLAVLVGVSLAPGRPAAVLAAPKKEAKAAKAATGSGAAAHKVNACGCYQDSTGACFCGRKGKCVCPGECEPKGCDEKRGKDMEREVKAETKRAQDIERKQKASAGKGKAASGAHDENRKESKSAAKKE